MTPDEQRFWRLFAEYERLVGEETFALQEQNFDYVQIVLNKKQAVLQALSLLEKTIDQHRDDWKDLEVRLGAIRSQQEGNAAMLEELMQDVQDDLDRVDVHSNRLQSLRGTYVTSSGRGRSSSSHFA